MTLHFHVRISDTVLPTVQVTALVDAIASNGTHFIQQLHDVPYSSGISCASELERQGLLPTNLQTSIGVGFKEPQGLKYWTNLNGESFTELDRHSRMSKETRSGVRYKLELQKNKRVEFDSEFPGRDARPSGAPSPTDRNRTTPRLPPISHLPSNDHIQ